MRGAARITVLKYSGCGACWVSKQKVEERGRGRKEGKGNKQGKMELKVQHDA
jgi:hypothetical protein